MESILLIQNNNSEYTCQYCGSTFKSKTNLSKHIDRIHTGSGLLEGDSRKW